MWLEFLTEWLNIQVSFLAKNVYLKSIIVLNGQNKERQRREFNEVKKIPPKYFFFTFLNFFSRLEETWTKKNKMFFLVPEPDFAMARPGRHGPARPGSGFVLLSETFTTKLNRSTSGQGQSLYDNGFFEADQKNDRASKMM